MKNKPRCGACNEPFNTVAEWTEHAKTCQHIRLYKQCLGRLKRRQGVKRK